MSDLQLGLNIMFNSIYRVWNWLVSDSVPLVIKMLVFAPFVGWILSLIIQVFGGSLSGKQDL